MAPTESSAHKGDKPDKPQPTQVNEPSPVRPPDKPTPTRPMERESEAQVEESDEPSS